MATKDLSWIGAKAAHDWTKANRTTRYADDPGTLHCRDCSYQTRFGKTKTGKPTSWFIRDWQEHIDSYNTAWYRVDVPPPRHVGSIIKPRVTIQYWIYHVNDPVLPELRRATWQQIDPVDQLSDARGEARLGTKVYWFTHPYWVIEINSLGASLKATYAGPLPAINRINQWLESAAAVKGHRIIAHTEVERGAVGAAPSLSTYLSMEIDRLREAKTSPQLLSALERVEELKPKIALLHAIEDELRERLLNPFT